MVRRRTGRAGYTVRNEEEGGCGLSRKGSFGEGVKGSENLVRNFVREEEGGKLSMLFWVGVR